jgi:hypothetical protein
MGRPRKPVSVHLIQKTFRPHRHAHLLPTGSKPVPSPPEPEPSPADQALRDEAEKWRCSFECGYDFFSETGVDDRDEAVFLAAAAKRPE